MSVKTQLLKANIGTRSVIECVSEQDFAASCPSLPTCVARSSTEKGVIRGLAEKIANWFIETDAREKLNYLPESLRKWYFVMPDMGYETEFCAHYSIQHNPDGKSLVICALPQLVCEYGANETPST